MASILESSSPAMSQETSSPGSEATSHSTTGATEPLMPPSMYTLVGLMLFFESVINMFNNGLALYIFYKNSQLRSPTNAFIMALVVCDLFMAAFTPMSAFSALAGTWLWGDTGCVIEGFAFYFLGLTSMYVLAAIALDRYVVIAKPLQAPMITSKVVAIAIGVCVFFGLLWSSLPLFGWSHYALEGAGISCSVVWASEDPYVFSFNITIFLNCFVFPVGAMLFSYYHVFMTIRTVARNTVFDASSRVAKRNLRIEKKMAKTVFAMIGTFLLSWTPYAVVSFISVFGGEVSPLTATLPAVVAKSAGFWNPLIYVATNKLFRSALYQVLPCSDFRDVLQKCEEDKDSSDDEKDNPKGKTENRTREPAPAAQIAPATAGQAEISEQMDTTMEDLASPARRSAAPAPPPGSAATVNASSSLTPVESLEMRDVKAKGSA